MVDQLLRIIERIETAAATARTLSEATDWQAKSASAFHEKSTLWAGEVAGLACLAETAKLDAMHARDRAALREADAYAALFAPAGAR